MIVSVLGRKWSLTPLRSGLFKLAGIQSWCKLSKKGSLNIKHSRWGSKKLQGNIYSHNSKNWLVIKVVNMPHSQESRKQFEVGTQRLPSISFLRVLLSSSFPRIHYYVRFLTEQKMRGGIVHSSLLIPQDALWPFTGMHYYALHLTEQQKRGRISYSSSSILLNYLSSACAGS